MSGLGPRPLCRAGAYPKAQPRAARNGSSKDANMGAPAGFRDEVAERFGVLPNFFCSAEAAPGLIERLWDFAKSAYLDNPLPSLFKERLFVHPLALLRGALLHRATCWFPGRPRAARGR